MSKKNARRSGIAISDTKRVVLEKLNEAYERAELIEQAGGKPNWRLSRRFIDALTVMSNSSSTASTAFTNVVTSLAIKSAHPELDIRYHQVQIGAPFNFRTISEKVVYPWLISNRFEGAKSGWQTRTFERPKPFMMDYDENIDGGVKEPFLTCYDEAQAQGEDALEALTFIAHMQLQLRERKKTDLAAVSRDYSALNDIAHIVNMFDKHFSYKYGVKGASRLPVLAVYAVYSVMAAEMGRYDGKTLLPLKSHSAADQRTGALGDIEVAQDDNRIFEALEIKHAIAITEHLINECALKIEELDYAVDRYYILTTHASSKPTPALHAKLKQIAAGTGCQIVVDGVLPTMQYYLRLLTEPGLVLPKYLELLTSEPAIDHTHRTTWIKILRGEI